MAFITVFQNGVSRSWTLGLCCVCICDYYSVRSRLDEYGDERLDDSEAGRQNGRMIEGLGRRKTERQEGGMSIGRQIDSFAQSRLGGGVMYVECRSQLGAEPIDTGICDDGHPRAQPSAYHFHCVVVFGVVIPWMVGDTLSGDCSLSP